MNHIGYKKTKTRRRSRSAGIRRKIRSGFLVLGLLLLFACVVSYLQLGRLGRVTNQLMEEALRDVELSNRMLAALEKQNEALLMKAGPSEPDLSNVDSLLAGWRAFGEAYAEAERTDAGTERLQRIGNAWKAYDSELRRALRSAGFDGRPVPGESYVKAYYDLSLGIREYLIDSQRSIDQTIILIRNNAYRAIMPGIITLAIAILILLVFYLLIDFYYIRPVLKIKRGLDNYLNFKSPYRVQIEGHDEVKELGEHVSTLATMASKKETNG